MQQSITYSKEKIRFAVLSYFLCQGLCFSTWASRIPSIKESFSISALNFWGIILFMIPVGKFVAIPIGGYLISKLGSKLMVQISILGYAVTLFAVGIVSNFAVGSHFGIYILAVFLIFFGIFWNLCDVSLNTQGICIERMFGKTIMASFHGGWSLAACMGALIGFVMINLHISPFIHFTIIAIIILLSTLFSRQYLQNEVSINPSEEGREVLNQVEPKKSMWKFRPEKILVLLGITGFFALIVESAMFDWGGIYFQSIVKAPETLQIGFLVFMVMMTVGRFSTHKAYALFGKQKTVVLAGSFIFIGLFISALLHNVYICSVIGFMLVGLGISCMVPTIYSVVGEKTKMPVGLALTLLSCISLVGSLLAPLFIGFISQSFNLEFAYMFVGILGLIIVLMASFSSAFKIISQKE